MPQRARTKTIISAQEDRSTRSTLLEMIEDEFAGRVEGHDTGALRQSAGFQAAVLVLPLARVDVNGTPCFRVPQIGMVAARCISTFSDLFVTGRVCDGTPVVLAFEAGDPQRPIVIGLLGPVAPPPVRAAEALVDGKKVMLTGEEEVTLRCGKASITLTKAGKVLITGDYLVSRSRGVNRIKGGSVQIN
jgi:hypothetical protein